MDRIKSVFNPGAKADNEILYGQGTPDNTGKLAGEGNHFGHSRTTVDPAGNTTGTTGLGSTAEPGVANTPSGFEGDVNDASSTTATRGGIPGTTQPATHTGHSNPFTSSSEGAHGSSTTAPGHRHEGIQALASSRAEKGPQDTLQPDQHSSSAIAEDRGHNTTGIASTTGSSMNNRQDLGGAGSGSYPQNTLSSSNPYSSSAIDPRVDANRSSAGRDHHVGRDAALGGTTAAGAGYAAEKYHEKSHDTPSTATGSQVAGNTPSDSTGTTGASTGYNPSSTTASTAGSYATGTEAGASTIGSTGASTGHNQSSVPIPIRESHGTTTSPSSTNITGASTGHPHSTTSAATGHLSSTTGAHVPSATEEGIHIDRFPDSEGNIGGSGYHTGPIGTAVSSDTPRQAAGSTGNTQASKPEQTHHGRDAILGAGAIGAAGAGHELKEHHDRISVPQSTSGGEYDSQRQTGGAGVLPGSGSAAQQYPTAHSTATGTTALPSSGTERQQDGQHHYGRDAAVLGGTGAATGLGAHEYDTHGDHGSQDQHRTATTTQHQQPTSAAHQSDPQPKEHHHGRDAATMGGAGATAGVAVHEHDSKKEQKEFEKQEKAHEKELQKEDKAYEKEAKKVEKEHEKELKHQQREQEKAYKADDSSHKSGGILGFLHRDKKSKDEVEEEKHGSHKKELAGAGAVGVGGTALADHEHNKHKTEAGQSSATTASTDPHDRGAAASGVGAGGAAFASREHSGHRVEGQSMAGTTGIPHNTNERSFPLSGQTDTNTSTLGHNETERGYAKSTESGSHKREALAAGAGGAALAGHEHNKHSEDAALSSNTTDHGPGSLAHRDNRFHGKEGGAPGAIGLAPDDYNSNKHQGYSDSKAAHQQHATHSQTATESEPKEEKKSHGILGFLHKDKDVKDETDSHHSHDKKTAAAGAVGGAAVAEHEHTKHDDRNRLHKVGSITSKTLNNN